MAKIREIHVKGRRAFAFYCPGCKCVHYFNDKWYFNHSYESPTVSPGIVSGASDALSCSAIVTNGMIMFDQECRHDLRGMGAPLPDWHDDMLPGIVESENRYAQRKAG